MGTFVWHASLGKLLFRIVRFGTFDGGISPRGFRLGVDASDLSFGVFRLGLVAQDFSLENCRLEIFAWKR